MSDLELYTCEELIEELTSRQTWVGFVVNSLDESRPPYATGHNKFTLRFNPDIFGLPGMRLLLSELLAKLPSNEDVSS